MSRAIVLFGHGARNAGYVAPFERIRDTMLAQNPAAKIAIGFLELSRPSLEEAVESLLAQGEANIRLVPIFFAPGRHVLQDLPLRCAALMERHPALDIEIIECVGLVDDVIAAMAAHALGAE